MNIQLRPITNELVDLLPKWAQKEELQEYFRAWPALQDWNRADIIAQRIDWGFGIYEDDKLVGIVQLCYPNNIAKAIEMGMLVDSDLSKNRYLASDIAHDLMIDYLKNLGYQKIYMRILSHRTKLRDRLCKFGYIVEGHLKRSAKLNGEFRDEFLLAYFIGV